MAALALIRHGAYHQLADTPSALQPYPLTKGGAEEVRQQARNFRKWLSETGFTLQPEIHCSTLLRAWQTAEIFREELREFFMVPASTQCFQSLCERSVGAVANMTVSEIERVVELDPRYDPLPPGWKSQSDFRLPFDGAESLLGAGERVAEHLGQLSLSGSESKVQLVVGHGASIRHACYHMNVLAFDDIKRLSMFYGRPVVFHQQDAGWSRIYGEWKKRRSVDPID